VSSIASYSGRTIDIAAWTGQQIGSTVQVTPALADAGQGGEACTGVVKLAQRWQVEFFTITGSMTFLPARGCLFMQQLQQGQLQTTMDVEQAFYLAASTVASNLAAEDKIATPTPPADEQLASATLLSVTITADTLLISVQLTSQAGTARTVILPVANTI